MILHANWIVNMKGEIKSIFVSDFRVGSEWARA